MAKTRKIFAAGIAVVLALAIGLTGTFAWQSISQQALNEAAQKYINPGGRLHDDFNGTNKDVYVENFVSADDPAGVPIYARIRLDEYMEIGTGAGLKLGDAGYDTKKAQPLETGANVNDVSTWKTHLPEEGNPAGSSSAFRKYFTWEMGGKTVYMPTFNKNKDSLKADINGTLAGPDGDPSTQEDRYKDYVEYIAGQNKQGNAYYDTDENDVDEGENGLENVNYTVQNETHIAAETKEAMVMTMAEWKAKGSPTGPYWVYDTDGWAYWADAIRPGETTGLLLSGIEPTSPLNESWYYGINVVGQFSDGGDWGQEDGTGFYAPDAGVPPSEDALALLNQAAGQVKDLTVTAEGDLKETFGGNSLQFQVKEGEEVQWSVSGQTSAGTSISETGVLTIGLDEAADTVLTITATAKNSSRKGSYTIIVKAPWNPELVQITPGSNQTVSIDGLDWYVLAREGNKALVIPQYAQEEMAFDDTDNVWEGSDIQTYLNGAWLDGKPTLKAHAQDTTFYTRKEFNSLDYIESTDKAFLLSEADAFGEHDHDPTQEPKDYTLGKPGIILPEDLRIGLKEGGGPAYYWLRSPSGAETYVASVLWGNEESYNYRCTGNHRIRPVLWLDLVQ